MLNTGQVNYQIHHTNNIIVANGKPKQPQPNSQKKQSTKASARQTVNASYENARGQIAEVKNSAITASGGVSSLQLSIYQHMRGSSFPVEKVPSMNVL